MEQLSTVVIAVVTQAPLAAVFALMWWRATKRADRLEAMVIECMEARSGVDITPDNKTPI